MMAAYHSAIIIMERRADRRADQISTPGVTHVTCRTCRPWCATDEKQWRHRQRMITDNPRGTAARVPAVRVDGVGHYERVCRRASALTVSVAIVRALGQRRDDRRRVGGRSVRYQVTKEDL